MAILLVFCLKVPSEYRFCEQLRYHLLFKCFLDLNAED